MSNVIQFPMHPGRILDPEVVEKFNRTESYHRKKRKNALRGVIDALEPLGLDIDRARILQAAGKFYTINLEIDW